MSLIDKTGACYVCNENPCECVLRAQKLTATQAYTPQMELFHRTVRDLNWLLLGAPDDRIRARLAYVVSPEEYIALNRCVIKSYSDPIGELRILGVPIIPMRDFNNENNLGDRRIPDTGDVLRVPDRSGTEGQT